MPSIRAPRAWDPRPPGTVPWRFLRCGALTGSPSCIKSPDATYDENGCARLTFRAWASFRTAPGVLLADRQVAQGDARVERRANGHGRLVEDDHVGVVLRHALRLHAGRRGAKEDHRAGHLLQYVGEVL